MATEVSSVPLLLVMCTGNVCRSPMAEALMSSLIEKQHLPAEVISRGLAAPIGRSPHKFAIELCRNHGIQISLDKRAAAVTSVEVARAAAIFVMDDGHRREVQKKYPTASGKTFLLGHWQSQEIADPINQPIAAFETAWRQIEEGVNVWIERLVKVGVIRSSQMA